MDAYTNEITLEGRRLRLEPASMKHLESLTENMLYPNSWFATYSGLATKADVEKKLLDAPANRKDGSMNAFAMVIKETNQAVGLSHYLYINRRSQTLEIGFTSIGEKWQKTFVNTEAKLLMLTYAFETLGCMRVAFKVDAYNFNSQRAVRRLGAKYEGEIRNYVKLADGRKRDFHFYSIIDSEWPNVKKTLEYYLEKNYVAGKN